MVTNENAASTTATKSPEELYDKLSDTQQTVWDLIGTFGFRPDRDDETNQWWAYSMTGDEKVGPKPSISDLATAVQAVVEAKDPNAPKVAKIQANSKGDRFLEGMEPIVDAEIAEAAGKYHAIKMERCGLSAQEKVAKDELAEVCHRKPELFKVDPDNTNEKIYKISDLVVRIANEVKEKISTEIVETDNF